MSRDFDERKRIFRAIMSGNEDEVANFNLAASEDNFFRSRAARSLDEAASKASKFKAYYSLPTAKPFLYVIVPSLTIVAAAAVFAILIYNVVGDKSKAAPIFAACLTITVIALGWVFVGWNSHNNTIRQNTNNIIFARFAHQSFGDAVHRFHMKFGYDKDLRVSWEVFSRLRQSNNEEDLKAAAALAYLLNYFEFIASGVVRGDLDKKVVRDTIKGNIVFYHDKCWPIIIALRRDNPHTFEFLTKIRAHYRET